MALKLNIKPELDNEINELLALSGARSKTEYINRAIAELNARLKRQRDLEALRNYFSDPDHRREEEIILNDFSQVKEAER